MKPVKQDPVTFSEYSLKVQQLKAFDYIDIMLAVACIVLFIATSKS